jgi:hypothetical protein
MMTQIGKEIAHYRILEKLGEARPACDDASTGRLLKTCKEKIHEASNG